MDEQKKFFFVIQNKNEEYDLMPFSIARTWLDDKGLDIAIYLMYDAVNLVRKDEIEKRDDLKEVVEYLLSKNVPIYTCGFCTRACKLGGEDYYPGVQVANRNIYFAEMMGRRVINY